MIAVSVRSPFGKYKAKQIIGQDGSRQNFRIKSLLTSAVDVSILLVHELCFPMISMKYDTIHIGSTAAFKHFIGNKNVTHI